MSGRKLTVCQVLLSLVVGGAEVLAARLARRLSGEFRVIFACLDEIGPLGEELRAEGFEVHVLGRQPGIDLKCGLRLGKLFRSERVDVIHAHQYGPFFYSALARLPSGRPPIVYMEHGFHHTDVPRASHKIVNRLLLGSRDRVFAVGRDVRRLLIDNEGFPADRIEVVYNGIEASRFEGVRGDREVVRREIGVGPADFVIAHVARLSPIKDHDTAIRSVAQVARSRPDVRLWIVGDGVQEGPIRELIRELGLESHVQMLGSRSDVPRLLGAVDLALLTSLSEGIPLALIEAMATGLPVVATRVGGMPEVVMEGVTGLLAPVGASDELAKAILDLAENPELRERMGTQARIRARDEFSEDRMVEGYRQAYCNAVVARPRRGNS